MDPSTQISEEKKNMLHRSLADAILAGLESGALSIEDSETSSQFMLEQLDLVSTEEDLVGFLDTLSTRWPIYRPIFDREKENVVKDSDATQIDQALTELKTISQ